MWWSFWMNLQNKWKTFQLRSLLLYTKKIKWLNSIKINSIFFWKFGNHQKLKINKRRKCITKLNRRTYILAYMDWYPVVVFSGQAIELKVIRINIYQSLDCHLQNGVFEKFEISIRYIFGFPSRIWTKFPDS